MAATTAPSTPDGAAHVPQELLATRRAEPPPPKVKKKAHAQRPQTAAPTEIQPLFHQIEWRSATPPGPKLRQLTSRASTWLIESPKWQTYLAANRPRHIVVILAFDDVATPTVDVRKLVDQPTEVTVSIPANLFHGDRDDKDVFRFLAFRSYVAIAHEFRWPAPDGP